MLIATKKKSLILQGETLSGHKREQRMQNTAILAKNTLLEILIDNRFSIDQIY